MINIEPLDISNITFDYSIFTIKKKNGGVRYINSPNDGLKNIQQKLKYLIENSDIELPNYITGFRKGLSIKDNASFHVNKKVILNIDLKNFFDSITTNKIKSFFEDKVDNIEKFINITTLNGKLPMGAPSSPIIGNLIFAEIDKKIIGYFERNYENFNYSRYVDDISISFNNDINHINIINYLNFILSNNGYTINEKKTKVYTNTYKQIVTGLVVNERVAYPRYNYRIMRSKICNFILKGEGYFPEIKGFLNFLHGVDQKKYEMLEKNYLKFKDIQGYKDLFIGVSRPIENETYSYGKRNSRRGSCVKKG